MKPIEHGDYVETPSGTGRVVYVRMTPPDYATPAAVSVLLDAHRHRLEYRGTVFLANRVTKVRDANPVF